MRKKWGQGHYNKNVDECGNHRQFIWPDGHWQSKHGRGVLWPGQQPLYLYWASKAPVFFVPSLRRRLGMDAASSGVASMTEAAAAACSETNKNKARELFRKEETKQNKTKRHRNIIRRTQQLNSIFLFDVGLCLQIQYPSTYGLCRRVPITLTAPPQHPPEGHQHQWPQQTRDSNKRKRDKMTQMPQRRLQISYGRERERERERETCATIIDCEGKSIAQTSNICICLCAVC